ncbi:hypothetical protein ACTXT7_017240 [Hymenolepis weldensis]
MERTNHFPIQDAFKQPKAELQHKKRPKSHSYHHMYIKNPPFWTVLISDIAFGGSNWFGASKVIVNNILIPLTADSGNSSKPVNIWFLTLPLRRRNFKITVLCPRRSSKSEHRNRARRNGRSVEETSRRRVMRRRLSNNTITANNRQLRDRGYLVNTGLTRPPRVSAPLHQTRSPPNQGSSENTSEPNLPTNSAPIPRALIPLNIIIWQIYTYILRIIPRIRSIDTTTTNLLSIFVNFAIDFLEIVEDIYNPHGNGDGN